MARRMLIDASHPEETRVVVVDGTKLTEFDFETGSRKPLKGNIYLAKVIRIEPSLQAAFVEYGGNRHGFLAFSEIHPDYFQIPVADREKLIAEQQRLADEEPEHRSERFDRTDIEDARGRGSKRPPRRRRRGDDREVGRGASRAAEAVEEAPLPGHGGACGVRGVVERRGCGGNGCRTKERDRAGAHFGSSTVGSSCRGRRKAPHPLRIRTAKPRLSSRSARAAADEAGR